jgi:hypothetical protein
MGCASVEDQQACFLACAPSEAEDELLSFTNADSAVDVSCTLLRQFGTYTTAGRSNKVTVRLPARIDKIELVGDIVVKAGQRVRIEATEGQLVNVIVGRWQLRVEPTAQLELVRLALSGSTGGSVVHNEGDLVIDSCLFSRNAASINAILRFVEVLAAGDVDTSGSGSAFLAAMGGAVLSVGTNASISVFSTRFEGNSVSSARAANLGGAIGGLGGTASIRGAFLSKNTATGGTVAAWGGALFFFFAKNVSIENAEFTQNEVSLLDPMSTADCLVTSGMYAYGGAIHVQQSAGTVRASVFQFNVASGGSQSSFGGAISVADSSSLDVDSSSLFHNEAHSSRRSVGGGAIRVSSSRSHWLQLAWHLGGVACGGRLQGPRMGGRDSGRMRC